MPIQRDAGLPSKLLPFVTTLLFVFFSVLPLHLPGFAEIAPAFALMAVYHWTIYRPDLLPPFAVFVAGVLLDLLSGTLDFGLSPMSLLIARGVLMGQLKKKRAE